MTLEKKIRPHTKSWDCYNDEPLKYNHTRKVCKIVEEFAIGFAIWCIDYTYHKSFDVWIKNNNSKAEKFTKKELLEIYKKEKGL